MKKYLFLIIFLVIISNINYSWKDSISWSNGSYADNQTNYDYNTDYGTHDWIADNILDILLSQDESKWNWLSERETIFLVGTEAPDNSGVQMTLNEIVVNGFGDTTWHHIYFNENGTIKNNEDDSALRAKSCGDIANSYINDEKLDLASFYLGAMTHYIADLSMYSHTTENDVDPYNVNFDLHHSQIEGYVNTRSNEYDNKEEFFKINDYTLTSSENPYDVAIALAWNTYNDSNPTESTIRNAYWLHCNFFTWTGFSSYADRSSGTSTEQLYFNRIEESLNLAIQSCIKAMYSISEFKESDDDNDDDDKEKDSDNSMPSYPFLILFFSIIGTFLVKIFKIKQKKN